MGQAKINDLDPGSSGVHTHDVLRLKVQMDDILLVNILDTLQELLHVASTCGLIVFVVFVHNAFKQLPSGNAGETNTQSLFLSSHDTAENN